MREGDGKGRAVQLRSRSWVRGNHSEESLLTRLHLRSTHGLVGACIGVFYVRARASFSGGALRVGARGKTWKAVSEACGELCRLSGWCFIASFRYAASGWTGSEGLFDGESYDRKIQDQKHVPLLQPGKWCSE